MIFPTFFHSLFEERHVEGNLVWVAKGSVVEQRRWRERLAKASDSAIDVASRSWAYVWYHWLLWGLGTLLCSSNSLTAFYPLASVSQSESGDENCFVGLLMRSKRSVKNVSRHTYVSFSLGHQFLVHKMTSHIRRHARSTLRVCGLVLCFLLQQVTHFTQESEFWSFLSLVTCLGNRQWWAWPFSVATQSSREQPMWDALCCWAWVSSG